MADERGASSGMALTYLTVEEIDVLAKGLAALVDKRQKPLNAHEASGVVWRKVLATPRPSAELRRMAALSTHLAELSYELRG